MKSSVEVDQRKETPTKRKRARPSKNSTMHFKSPEFFTIYLPQHNSKQLVIPPAFVKNMKRIPKKIVLKNIWGRVWIVDLEQSETKLLMTKNWENFVIENSLKLGEFLIFKNSGAAVFTVKVFGVNGCLKVETIANNDKPDMNVENHTNSDESFNNHTDSCRKQIECAKVETIANGDQPDMNVEIHTISDDSFRNHNTDDCRKHSECAKEETTANNDQPDMNVEMHTISDESFSNHNTDDCRKHSECVKEETTANNDQPDMNVEMHTISDESFSNHNTDDCRKHFERRPSFEKVSEDSCDEVKPKSVPEKTSQPKRMRFQRQFDGRPYQLHIPANIIKEFKVKMPPTIKTPQKIRIRGRGVSGTSAKIYQTTGRRVLITTGWRNFQEKAKMVKGDEYEYELILDKDRRIKEILVL